MHPSKPWTVPVTQLSRREFFSIPLASLFVQKATASPRHAGLAFPTALTHIASHDPTGETAWLGAGQECSECHGLGFITCSACDGTGRWTEASESAGALQREAARQASRCAWCDELGEMVCSWCEGLGLFAPVVRNRGTELQRTGGFLYGRDSWRKKSEH